MPFRNQRRYLPYLERLENRTTPALNFAWGFQAGANFADWAQAVATDSSDNVYVTGFFQGTADFDPGTGTTNLTSAGALDAYIAKYSPAGNLIWARSLGGPGNDSAQGIAIDGLGNALVVGSFNGTVDFDPGTGTSNLTSAGADDVFVLKLDSSGNFVWAGQLGGAGADVGNAIALNSADDIFVTGNFNGTGDFDPGAGNSTLTSAGNTDVFVTRLSSSGAFVWARAMGGLGQDHGNDIGLDSTGNVYTTGSFAASADFDPGTGTSNLTSAGGLDIFVSELDSSGNYVWAGAMGSSALSPEDEAYALAIDAVGNVYVTGHFAGNADMDPGTGTTTLNSLGADDSFIVKIDSSHNLAWARQLGGSDVEQGNDIALDAAGNVYAIGFFFRTSDFDPGPGTFDLTSSGIEDIWIAQLDTSGNFVWAGQMGGAAGNDWGLGITVDSSGNVLVCGKFNNTGDFDPGPGTASLTGSADQIFVVKLGGSNPGVTVTQSGGSTNVGEGGPTDTYTVVLTSAPSADVTITLSGGSQLSPAPTSLTFTTSNWSTPQTVTVTAVDDALVEGSHTGVITHAIASGDTAYASLTIAPLTANITDNDTGPPAGVTITQSSGSTNVAEAGATDTYTVVLNAAPSANVTITLSGGTQLTPTPTTLTFTTANWNVPQTVTVAAVDDTLVENTHSGVIAHTAASSDSRYAGIAIPGVTATITDNDIDSGTLIIYGTEKADRITATFSTRLIQVAVNGKVTFYQNTYPSVLVLAGNGVNRIQITNPSVPVTIVGGGARDDVVLDGQPAASAFTIGAGAVDVNGRSISLTDIDAVLVSGKTAADTFAVLDVPAFAVTIQAGGGKDTLVAPDQANSWRFLASDAGTLDGTIAFSFVENLTGGSDDDNFWFATGKFSSGLIDGGAGSNTLDFSAHKTPLTVNLQPAVPTVNTTHRFQNVAAILSGAASDKLLAAHQSNTWNITGYNQGDVNGLSFTSVENLTGGSLDDTFLFADGQGIKGKLDGGGGIDLLDLSAFTSFVLVNLQTKVTLSQGGLIGFANLESFVGGAAVDTLIAPNKVNTWNLTDVGTGTLPGVDFANFENLTGGSVVDTFNFSGAGEWLGLLDGAAGNDIVNALAGWTYQLSGANNGTLNGRNFRSIETRR